MGAEKPGKWGRLLRGRPRGPGKEGAVVTMADIYSVPAGAVPGSKYLTETPCRIIQ